MKQTLNNIVRFIPFLLMLVFAITPVAHALDFGEEISNEDKATFDQILEPLLKVYNLVKYAASGIAVLVLLFAGITYMVSGSDPKKRDNAKSMATYVVIGLAVIWASPMVVNFLV